MLLYAALEFPFANPVVQMVFWTAFFCAVRYVRLIERQASRESSLSDSRQAPRLKLPDPT